MSDSANCRSIAFAASSPSSAKSSLRTRRRSRWAPWRRDHLAVLHEREALSERRLSCWSQTPHDSSASTIRAWTRRRARQSTHSLGRASRNASIATPSAPLHAALQPRPGRSETLIVGKPSARPYSTLATTSRRQRAASNVTGNTRSPRHTRRVCCCVRAAWPAVGVPRVVRWRKRSCQLCPARVVQNYGYGAAGSCVSATGAEVPTVTLVAVGGTWNPWLVRGTATVWLLTVASTWVTPSGATP